MEIRVVAKERSLKWPLILGCGCGIPFITGVIAIAWLLYPLMQPVQRHSISIPAPKMPSPNAFDLYISAGDSLQDQEDIDSLYSNESAQPAHAGREDNVQAKRIIVRKNAAALRKLRNAAEYEYKTPPCRSIDQAFPYLAQFRRMARLLAIESQVKAAEGDWPGVVDSCLDAALFGERIPRGGPLIHKLVGAAVQTIGRQNAWKAIDHLNSRQARAAARRVEAITSMHVPFGETLQEEKWYGLASLTEILNGKSVIPSDPSVSMAKIPEFLKRRTLNQYAMRMDQYISHTRKAYPTRPPMSDKPRRFHPLTAIPDTLCDMMLPVFDKAWLSDVRNITQNALLQTTLALRAYRLEQGRYPARLNDLTPFYLSEVPADPFAPKGALRYKRTDNKYVLYSIGPDGKDNGGRPIDNPKPTTSAGATPVPPSSRYAVRTESKGDIVAGINIW